MIFWHSGAWRCPYTILSHDAKLTEALREVDWVTVILISLFLKNVVVFYSFEGPPMIAPVSI